MCFRLRKKQNGHLPCLMADVSGCAQKCSQTCLASHTFNIEYYSTEILIHIIAHVYQDSASSEDIKMCFRLSKKQNRHLPCMMADVSGCAKSNPFASIFQSLHS